MNLSPCVKAGIRWITLLHNYTFYRYKLYALVWLEKLRVIVNSVSPIFSVFTSHVMKTKNRNHSVNKVKNLGYDRWLIYKQPRQESGLCSFSFASYLQKCVTQIYRACLCMETPCLCPSEGHKHGGRKVTETSVTELCYWNKNYCSRNSTHWNRCFF